MLPQLYDYRLTYGTTLLHRRHTTTLVDMSRWYGHDMQVFPMTGLVFTDENTGDLVRTTHSAFIMPLIYDALGHGHVFPFPRPTAETGFDWARHTGILRRFFQRRNMTLANIPHDGPFHAPAEFQDQLFGEYELRVTAHELALFVSAVQNEAEAAAEAAGGGAAAEGAANSSEDLDIDDSPASYDEPPLQRRYVVILANSPIYKQLPGTKLTIKPP